MRRLVLRCLLVSIVPLALVAPRPADAAKEIPGGCDLFRNTMCHCLGPGALQCAPVLP